MRFVPALVASVALVLAGPIIGQLRSALLARFPDSYRGILLAIVLAAVALVLLAAILRIRSHRGLRYGLLALALAIAAGYSWLSRSGNPSVDAVERFHFIEYGAITFLFYRAWRSVQSITDASVLILPVLCGLLVGICEEWFQWFVPARVGDVRDVFLNLWAILCGVLFSVAIDPPPLTRTLPAASRKRIRQLSAAVVVIFGAFFQCAHLGYRINDPVAPFYSFYSPGELERLAKDRYERWRTNPPLRWRRYSREDQYFSEGVALVQARNRCWDAGDVLCAWTDNLIAERYYAPVLDMPSFVSQDRLRWPNQQRADAAARVKNVQAVAQRPFGANVVYAWNKVLFWIVLGVIAIELLDPLHLIGRGSRYHSPRRI